VPTDVARQPASHVSPSPSFAKAPESKPPVASRSVSAPVPSEKTVSFSAENKSDSDDPMMREFLKSREEITMKKEEEKKEKKQFVRPQVDISALKQSIAQSMGKTAEGKVESRKSPPKADSQPEAGTAPLAEKGEGRNEVSVKQPGVLTLQELKKKSQEREMRERGAGGRNAEGGAEPSGSHAPDGIMPGGPKKI
jgi:hypothetical protein